MNTQTQILLLAAKGERMLQIAKALDVSRVRIKREFNDFRSLSGLTVTGMREVCEGMPDATIIQMIEEEIDAGIRLQDRRADERERQRDEDSRVRQVLQGVS